MKKIFKTFYCLILTAIFIVVLVLISSAIPQSPVKSFIVLSGSMEPEIKTGSVVVVKPEQEYQVDDVITFGESSKTKNPTTHRIVEIKKDQNDSDVSYVTKGDANNAPDQKEVSKEEVLGRVAFSVPYFGYAVAQAQTPFGFMLIIVVPAVIIIYDEAQKIKKEILKKIDYRKRMKKREEDKETEEKTPEK